MKNIKRILVLIIMAIVSVVGFTACGDPYKDMTLTIDKGGFENELVRRYEYSPLGNTFDITATIDGVDEDVSTDVVFALEDASIINISTDAVKDGNKTTQTFNVLSTGEAVIKVKSVEGNLSKDINVTIFAYADSISFIENTIPVIKGETIDLTKISSGYSQAPISFEPSYATEKSVTYKVYQDANGFIPINAGGTWKSEGNTITFSEDAAYDTLYLRAFGSNSVETNLTTIILLDPIDLSALGLSYTYTVEDTSNTRTFFDIDKSREEGIDYEVFLADQYSGDDARDAKNIYLTYKDGKNTKIASDFSLTMINDSSTQYSYIYSNATGSKKNVACYSICNGSGEGNYDIVKFNINYANYEKFFVGYDITLKITIDAFPNDVVISPVADLDAIEEQQSIMIYNNYLNRLGTPFYVKILNKGGEYIQNQYAYVNVYDTETFKNADSSYFNIYDANGNVVTAYTKVKSGSLLYIKYNTVSSNKPGDDKNTTDTDESLGRFVLYACSAIDSSITSLSKPFGEEGEVYTYNNLRLATPNYAVDFTNENNEITIMTNDDDSRVAVQFLCNNGTPGTSDYPYLSEFVITALNPNLVSIAYDSSDNKYYVEAVDENKLGSTILTIVAPNGTYDTIEVHVTKSPQASTFELVVGNLLLTSGDIITLNINVNSRKTIALLVDGIAYSTMPYGYEFTHACTPSYSGYANMVLTTGTTKSSSADTYEFYVKYAGQETAIANFTVNVNVIKPVNSITKSVSQVNLLFNDVDIINNATIDANLADSDNATKAYTDISDNSSKTVKFQFNPSDSTIAPEELNFEFKYDGVWYQIGDFTTISPEPGVEDFIRYRKSENFTPGTQIEIEGEQKDLTIGFTIEYYIDNDSVYMTLSNVSTNKSGNLDLSIRILYNQYYNLSVSKIYYIQEVYEDENVVNRYFFTNINDPEGSRVQYIGGQKISSEDVIEIDSNEHVQINNINFPIKETEFKDAEGHEYKSFEYNLYKIDMSSQIDFIVKRPVKTDSISFVGVNYDATTTRYYVGGAYNESATNKGFYLYTDLYDEESSKLSSDGIRYVFAFDGETPISVTINSSKTYTFATFSTFREKDFIISTNSEGKYVLIDSSGNVCSSIFGNDYKLEYVSDCGSCAECISSQECTDPKLLLTHYGHATFRSTRPCEICNECITGNTSGCTNHEFEIDSDPLEVRIGDVIRFLGYESISYFNYEQKLSYQSKTINKNQLDTINKQVYYIGSEEVDNGAGGTDTNYYIYTNILQPNMSRVYYIGGYAITNDNFKWDYTAPHVLPYLKLSNFEFPIYSKEYNGVNYQYIEITALKLYYKTSPTDVQLKGLLFKETNGRLISKFNYVNGSVIGASTMTDISTGYGISVSISYVSDYIEFLILGASTFENKMKELGYEWKLQFVAVDSYSASTDTFGVYKDFCLKLATGTEDNPYIIEDVNSFLAISTDLTAWYKVTQNISLYSVKDFVPFGVVGTDTTSFTGHIITEDDKEFTISGFNFNFVYNSLITSYGMFADFQGSIENITFKNFKVSLTVGADLNITNNRHVFIGAFAGKFNGVMTNCKFIDDETTNYDRYAVANIGNTSPYGVSLINNYEVNYSAADKCSMYYYIGGVFGTVVNSGTSGINNLSSSVKIYISASKENQIVYAGGVTGEINGEGINTATIYSVIYSNNTDSSSVVGGVVGNSKGVSCLSNIEVTTYINAYNNVGAVVGKGNEKITINNAVVVPYISANNNVGGVVGYSEGQVDIESTKVQFVEKDLNTSSILNSSIVANDNIGGMVGYSTNIVEISYSSVMTYVNSNMTLLGTKEEVSTNRNSYLGDIISTYHASRLGGFVGNVTAKTTISNNYYDANVVAYGDVSEYELDDSGNQIYGNIYFGGLVGYSSAYEWGKIYNTSVEGEFYYLSDDHTATMTDADENPITNTYTVVTGGFIGYIAEQYIPLSATSGYFAINYSADANGSVLACINKNNYSIFNSYTALKYAKIATLGTTTASYINNFVGANETIKQSEQTLTINIEATYDVDNQYLTIDYNTPNGIISKTYYSVGSEVSVDVDGDGTAELTLNSENTLGTINKEITIVPDRANILTYNSFYIGLKTFVNFTEITDQVDGEGNITGEILGSASYEEIEFTESGSTSSVVVADGIRFDYYSGHATDGTNNYVVFYNNLKQRVYAVDDVKLVGYEGEEIYSVNAGELIINENSLVNTDTSNANFITSILSGFTYVDETDGEGNLTRVYYDVYQGSKENLTYDRDKNVSYVVTSGTKLNSPDNNGTILQNGYDTYFNSTKDGENYNIASGRPVPFADYSNLNLNIDQSSDIPKLVIDISPTNLVVEVKNTYRPEITKKDTAIVTYHSLTSEQQTRYNQLVEMDEFSLSAEETEELLELEELVSANIANNRKLLSDIINITVIPELASNDVIYESSDKAVFIVSGDSIVVTGEGVAVLTIRSKLNSSLYVEINIVSVGFDFNSIDWKLYSSNSNKYFDNELNIVANSGDFISNEINYSGSTTFGIRYEFTSLTISGTEEHGKSTTDFINSLNIAGRSIKDYISGGNVQLNIDGLNHAISCKILGSVTITQKLYFKYVIDGVEYCKYFTTNAKTITYNFVEGLFGIDGSDEINIVVINSDTFSVVLESDADTFDIEMTATLNGITSDVYSGFKVDSVVNFSQTVGGYLTISLESVDYNVTKGLKTYVFRAYVDESDQSKVSDNLNYTLTFWVKDIDKSRFSHDVVVNIKPQEIDSIHVNHYTNILFTDNTDPSESNSGNYKYPSEIMMPGSQSLLQIDVFPSFGKFDYLTIVADTAGVVYNQVIEAYNFSEIFNKQYSWYEIYNVNNSKITNGIKIKDKYSYQDYDAMYGETLGYNGSIYVALATGDALSGQTIIFTVSCFVEGQQDCVYETTVELKVESRPAVVVDAVKNEFIFGESIELKINVQHTDSGFTASLKPVGENIDYIDVLASVTYSTIKRSYVLNVNNTTAIFEMFHDYMYKEFELAISASKIINGQVVTSTETIYLILVPFEVQAIDFNLAGVTKTNHNIIAEYYQMYEVEINVVANYSIGYASWLKLYKNSNNMAKQIEALNNSISDQIANSSILKQGTASKRINLLSSMQYEYSGEFNLQFVSKYSPAETTIRFISTEISEFLWAEVGINYTIFGIEVTNSEFATYSLSDYFSVVIDTASTDDRPEPITSVKELMNMREGVSYILMKDLYLANWSPIDAVFSTFDGNGFVLTLVSFADVSNITADEDGNYNIGIFKTIEEDQIVKNLTIEVNPSAVAVNHTEEDIENGNYDDLVNNSIASSDTTNSGNNVYGTKLLVDVTSITENVSFGLLAGTNNGTLTNINITNNATELRSLRDKALNEIYTKTYGLRITYGDNFTQSITRFSGVTDTDSVRVSYLKENETTTLSRGNKIALLVGNNSGFITNSSAENVTIEGEDYLAGLVASNSGKISSSYFSGGNIIGETDIKANSGCGGLVSLNSGEIYYSYVKGRTNSSDITTKITRRDFVTESLYEVYSGSGIITGNYAGGFVYENTGKINNSYARILVAGNNSSGFAHKNELAPEGDSEGSVIEFCYAISNIKKSSAGSFPFSDKYSKANKNVESGGTITDCFYFTNSNISTLLDDVAIGLERDDFTDYLSFVGYAFNVDYNNNNEIIDGVWFISTDVNNNSAVKQYLKSENVSEDAPELVNANQRTISFRYLISADDASAAYTYSYVQEVNILGGSDAEVASSRGSVLNPILISSAENFNKQVISQGSSENRNFRFINDIQFNESDEVATTYNTTFSGKLDGNGMTIENLRISADEVTDEGLTRLGLFAKIQGYPISMEYKVGEATQTLSQDSKGYYYVSGTNNKYVSESDVKFVYYNESTYLTSYAVVKNLNIEIEQIDGMNINMVGVLAGEIENGKIYNISVSGEEDIVVQGLNAVGGIAGRIKGETDLVNVSSNVSVKANYFYQYNAFTSFQGNKTNLLQKFYVYRNFTEEKLDELTSNSMDFGDTRLKTLLGWNVTETTTINIELTQADDGSPTSVSVKVDPLNLPDGADSTSVWNAFVEANFDTTKQYQSEKTFASIIDTVRQNLINSSTLSIKDDKTIDGDGETYINDIKKAIDRRKEIVGYAGDNLTQVSYAGGIVGICENNKYGELDSYADTELTTGSAEETRANMYRSRRLYTKGNISITGEVVGGIFGYMSHNSNMSDCEIVADSNMKLVASRVAGGLVGHNEGNVKRCYVENADQEAIDEDIAKNYAKYDNSTTDISLGTQTLFQSNAMYIGGLIGINYNAKLEYSYNKVNVVNKESLYAGGIVGLSIESKYDQIYTTASVYAYRGIGGLIGLVTGDIEGIDFFKNFANNETAIIFTNMDDTSSIAGISNVVVANIWSYSHLNPNRDTLANPNSTYASIGLLAGTYEEGENTTGAVEALGLSDLAFSTRAVEDIIYYKQTYTYNTVKNNSNRLLIREIGSGHEVISLMGKEIGDDNFISATEMYKSGDDSYLIYFAKTEDTKDPIDDYYYGKDEDGAKSDTEKESIIKDEFMADDSTTFKDTYLGDNLYSYYENNGMSMISGKFRDSFNSGTSGNDQQYYSYSRMASFGSFRTLEEIYSRKLIVKNANDSYKLIEGASSIKESEDEITVYYCNKTDANGDPTTLTKDDGADRITGVKASASPNNIYGSWKEGAWYGIGLNSEGNRTETEYVFPALKNSKDLFSTMFVYEAKDLLNIKTNQKSTFILMNDINMNDIGSAWTPVCGDLNTFTGTIRSAVVGDTDGLNIVGEDQVFTIFNLKIDIDNSYDSKYVGFIGRADGATFENFNLHIKSIKSNNAEVEYAGGLVGLAEDTTFKNVSVFGGTGSVSSTTITKENWLNTAVSSVSCTSKDEDGTIKTADVLLYNNDACAVKEYGTTQNLLASFSHSEYHNMVVAYASFVGGIAGRAVKCNMPEYYEVGDGTTSTSTPPESLQRTALECSIDATGVVTYTNNLESTYWYPTINVYNINMLCVGAGHQTPVDYPNVTNMTYYVGGAFGDLSVYNRVIVEEVDTDDLKRYVDDSTTADIVNYDDTPSNVVDKITMRDVYIKTVFRADADTTYEYNIDSATTDKIDLKVSKRISSFAYKTEVIPTGIYVGGFSGRTQGLSSVSGAKDLFNGLTILESKNGATENSVSITAEYGATAKMPFCDTIEIGGIFGAISVDYMRDIVINGCVQVNTCQSGSYYLSTSDPDGEGAQSGKSQNEYLGGLVGSAESIDIQYLTINKNVKFINQQTVFKDKDTTDSGNILSGCYVRAGGLVGYLSGSSILAHTYTLDDSTISVEIKASESEYYTTYPECYYGGVIGHSASSSEINNIIATIDCDYFVNHYSTSLGGFIGLNNGKISKVAITGQLDADMYVRNDNATYIGGIAGKNTKNIITTASNVNIYVDETTSDNSYNDIKYYIGGIAGYNTNGYVEDSYSTGNIVVCLDDKVSADYHAIGGIVGYGSISWLASDRCGIKHSYMVGSIYFKGDNTVATQLLDTKVVGGIVGYYSGTAPTGCYYNKDHVIMTNSYGTGLTTSQMLFGSSYSLPTTDGYWNANAVGQYQTLSWLDSVGVSKNNFLSSTDVTSINEYAATIQAEGTKVWPQEISDNNNICHADNGTYMYLSHVSNIHENKAYIFDLSTTSWTLDASQLLELVNTTIYFTGNNEMDAAFASVDKNSILNGLKLSSTNHFQIFNNEGYIVNCNFVSTDNTETQSYMIGSNSGAIVNCEFDLVSPKSSNIIIVGYYNPSYMVNTVAAQKQFVTSYEWIQEQIGAASATKDTQLSDPGLTLYSKLRVRALNPSYISASSESSVPHIQFFGWYMANIIDYLGIELYLECEFEINDTSETNYAIGLDGIYDASLNYNGIKTILKGYAINSTFKQYYESSYGDKGSLKQFYMVGSDKSTWYGTTSYTTANHDGDNVTEIDFSKAYYTGNFDFTDEWIWTSTTSYPQLQVFCKTHWTDTTVTKSYSWGVAGELVYNSVSSVINNQPDDKKTYSHYKPYVVYFTYTKSTKTFDNIDSAVELAFVLKYISTKTTNYTINLSGDINLTGKVWTPYTITGQLTLNGNGHTISNMIVAGSSTYQGGLFAQLCSGANINNLVLKNVTALTTTKDIRLRFGAVAGEAKNVTIEKVGVEGYNIYANKNNSDIYNGIFIGVYGKTNNLITDCYGSFEVNVCNNVCKGSKRYCFNQMGKRYTDGKIVINNYYSVAYDTTDNNAVIDYLTDFVNGRTITGKVVEITNSNLAEYQGILAESALPSFDFILDWQAIDDANVPKLDANDDGTTTDTEKSNFAYNQIKYNFGLPRFRTDVKFWWDIDKISTYSASEISTNGYKDEDSDGYIDGFWDDQDIVEHQDHWDEITITDVKGFVWFMKVVNNSSDVVDSSGNLIYQHDLAVQEDIPASTIREAEVTLGADIDLGGRVWTPIGSNYQDHYFTGVFNGCGKTISNMSCVGMYSGDTSSIKTTYSGLFGYVFRKTSATIYKTIIKNFTMTGARLTGTQYLGTAVAQAIGLSDNPVYIQDITVDNSSTRGYVSLVGNSLNSYVGGLVGDANNVVIFNNEVKGSANTLMLINTKLESTNRCYLGGIVGRSWYGYIAGNVVSYLELKNLFTTSSGNNAGTGGIIGGALDTHIISNRVGNYSQISTQSELETKFASDPNSISEYIKIHDTENIYSGGAIGYLQTGSNYILSEIAVYYNMSMMQTDGMVIGYSCYRSAIANNLYVAYNDGDLKDKGDRITEIEGVLNDKDTLSSSAYKFVGNDKADVRNSIITNLTYISIADGVKNYSLMAYQYSGISATYHNYFTNTNYVLSSDDKRLPTFLQETSAYRVDGINEYTGTGDIVQHYTPVTQDVNVLYINFWNSITAKQALCLTTTEGNVKFNWQDLNVECIPYNLWSADDYTSTGNGLTNAYEVSGTVQLQCLRNLTTFRVGVNVGFNVTFTSDLTISSRIGTELYPFGTNDSTKSFTVDGSGYTITLDISSSSNNCIGLFGYTKNINFKDITLTGSVTGKCYVGALVGKSVNTCTGGAVITNVNSSANVTGSAGVGGLVGYSENLTIQGCDTTTASLALGSGVATESEPTYASITGTVTGKGVGTSDSPDPFKFESSYIGVHLGGIVGMAYKNLTIKYMTVNGTIQVHEAIGTDRANAIGGFVGFYDDVYVSGSYVGALIVSNCEAGSTISSVNNFKILSTKTDDDYVSSFVGGVVGYSNGISSTSTIQDVRIWNANNEIQGHNYVGGIAGKFQGSITGSESVDGTSSKLCSYGRLMATGQYVGGVVGYISSGNITNAYRGYYIQPIAATYVGGIAGWFSSNGSTTYHIKECYSHSNINPYDVDGTTCVGGIAGVCDDGEILDCTSKMSPLGSSATISEIGGIVGRAYATNIKGCSYEGAINFINANRVGGIVGEYRFDITTSTSREISDNSLNSGLLAAHEYLGGLVGYLKNTSSYATLIINNSGTYASISAFEALLSGQSTVAAIAYLDTSASYKTIECDFDATNIRIFASVNASETIISSTSASGSWSPTSGTITNGKIANISGTYYMGIIYNSEPYNMNLLNCSCGKKLIEMTVSHATLSDLYVKGTSISRADSNHISRKDATTYEIDWGKVREGEDFCMRLKIVITYDNVKIQTQWYNAHPDWTTDYVERATIYYS